MTDFTISNQQTFIPFSAKHPAVELCRINQDGSCTYNWSEIERVAATWRPTNHDMIVCLAKLLSELAVEQK